MDININESLRAEIKKEFSLRKASSKNPYSHTVGWPVYDENELCAALDSLLDLRLSQGPRVKEFEEAYTNYLGLEENSGAIAVNSGSSANLICFAALIEAGKLKKGDEVIVPSSTFATVSSILYQLDLIPVYVDSELNSWNLDPNELPRALSKKTKAIMVVHNLGFPAEMDSIMEFASQNNLLVVEDCCEAHGAFYKGKQVGSIGDLATLSFFVAHNITTGEGGMVFYKDRFLDNKMRSVREFGRSINFKERYKDYPNLGEYDSRYIFETLGYNVRMTDFVASIGLVQLNKLESLNKVRLKNAERLREIIHPYSNFLSTLSYDEQVKPGYYGFPLYLIPNGKMNRNEFCKKLENFSIETRPNMGGCLPDQPGFVDRNHRIVGNLENARLIRDNSLFIGVHSELSDENFENFKISLEKIFN